MEHRTATDLERENERLRIRLAKAEREVDRLRGASISHGWRLVPQEPTEAMLDQFAGTSVYRLPPAKQKAEYKAYAAMLAVAPEPPE